jgi:hypothetical protein
MTVASAVALVVYALAAGAAAVLVWRRPVLALYLWVVGLASHNLVMALLWGVGVRGGSLDVIQAWKEILLAVALVRVAADAARARRLAFRPGLVDALALAYLAVVLVYAVVPQSALDGSAGPKGILYGLRHAAVPVAAFFLGRSIRLENAQLRSLGWTVVGAAAAVAAFGLVEEYTVPVEWWRHSGAVGYFRNQLGLVYHGPAGLPENFAFNTSSGLFRRLVSTFISPLGTGYMLVGALLVAAAWRLLWRRRTLLVAASAVIFSGLLFTFSRSAVVALAVGLAVLAVARREWWPAGAAVAAVAVGFGFATAYPSIAPRTHWFASDLPYQIARAKAQGPLPTGSGLNKTISLGEPSIREHIDSLRDGVRTVVHHPQGFGLGNSGQTATRFGATLRAGESTYTELGADTGILGLLLFAAWSLALLFELVAGAIRTADGIVAGVAAALAAMLALALQTDVLGIPWLAYTLWVLAGIALSAVSRTA